MFRVLGFAKQKTLTLRMDLSMSRDMWDPMRANVGFAANVFYKIGGEHPKMDENRDIYGITGMRDSF